MLTLTHTHTHTHTHTQATWTKDLENTLFHRFTPYFEERNLPADEAVFNRSAEPEEPLTSSATGAGATVAGLAAAERFLTSLRTDLLPMFDNVAILRKASRMKAEGAAECLNDLHARVKELRAATRVAGGGGGAAQGRRGRKRRLVVSDDEDGGVQEGAEADSDSADSFMREARRAERREKKERRKKERKEKKSKKEKKEKKAKRARVEVEESGGGSSDGGGGGRGGGSAMEVD